MSSVIALTSSGATIRLLADVERAGPFGNGNPAPTFAFPAHRVDYVEAVTNGHVRLKLGSGGDSFKGIAFRAAETPLGQALLAGLNVFLFSDNVPLADEVELKRLASERGLLLMGPDCGTALIGGAPLGFANAVRRGAIGVVGSSGTGLQEVTSLIHRLGGGDCLRMRVFGPTRFRCAGPVGTRYVLAVVRP